MSGLVQRHWRWPALVVIAGLGYWHFAARAAAPPLHLQFRQLTSSGQVIDAVISPDGKFLAHVDNGPQGASLHLLSIASGSDVQIRPPAPGCCQSPSFSPDGSQVYFLEDLTLKAVPVLGGAGRTIASHACSGAGFSPDGSRIAFVTTQAPKSELMLAQADGSQAHQINETPTGEGYLSQCWVSAPGLPSHAPAWSPDGRWIALDQSSTSGTSHIALISAADGKEQFLGPEVASIPTADLNWLPDGKGLIFTATRSATATPQIWQLSYPGGQLKQLTDDLQGYNTASVSQAGTWTVVHGAPQSWIWAQSHPGGAFQQLPGGGPDQDGSAGLTWTPEGELITLRLLGQQSQIWSENSDGGGARKLPVEHVPENAYGPLAAPNGPIVFGAGTTLDSLWRVNRDGTGLAQIVPTRVGAQPVNPTLSDGGREVVYMQVGTGTQTLWGVPLSGGTPRQLWPGFIYASPIPASPDGKRIFLVANVPGHVHQPVILRLDGGTPLITPVPLDRTDAEHVMAWAADGKALTYYVNQGTVGNIWALPLGGGKPYPLTHFTDLDINDYALAADGRLAVSRGTPDSDAIVVTHAAEKGTDAH